MSSFLFSANQHLRKKKECEHGGMSLSQIHELRRKVVGPEEQNCAIVIGAGSILGVFLR